MPHAPDSFSSSASWRERFDILLRGQVRTLLEVHHIDTRTIEILVDRDHVVLLGQVPDDLTRELVADLACWVPQVKRCDNHLEVAPEAVETSVGAELAAAE